MDEKEKKLLINIIERSNHLSWKQKFFYIIVTIPQKTRTPYKYLSFKD